MSQPFILRDEAVRARAIGFISGLDMKTVWQVTIAPYRKNRSLNQNALYHRWIGLIAHETGNGHDDTHEAMKAMFLPPKFLTVGERTVEIRRSTTKLNTKEMHEFMTQVEAWSASELGIVLPRPEDMGYAA